VPDRWKRQTLLVWCVLLSMLVLAPVLRPGYILHLDMVFVPRQILLPWNLGIGGGLPRSVPQDAVVALLAGPIPGQVLQKAVLVAILVLAGLGAGRLAGGGRLAQCATASLYLWSAYLAARLLMGHWGLLWAYSLLPWVVLAARRARVTGQWQALAALCGLGALVPTGGIMLAVAGLPLGLGFGSRVVNRTRVLVVAAVVLLNAPWWLPALRNPVADVSDPFGLSVFGARADGPGGVLASVLAGGGVWNSQATLGSRTTWFAVLLSAVVVVLAGIGWRERLSSQRAESLWLAVLGIIGLTWAWLSGVAGEQGWAQSVVAGLPGGGLLRDGQKWTVSWVLLLAICAPSGLARLSTHADRALRVFLATALALLPLAALPDLAWGGFGRLRAVSYPQQWDGLRTHLLNSAQPGDVVSLPWAAFRRYAWNHDQVVLDPMPRFLTRTVVWNDRLPVTDRGRLVEVGGDDPRAALIGRAITAGRPLGPVLADLGVRWILLQQDQPQPGRSPDLTGTQPVWQAADLSLLEVTDPVRLRQPTDVLVVLVDLTALGVLMALGAASLRQRYRRRADGTVGGQVP